MSNGTNPGTNPVTGTRATDDRLPAARPRTTMDVYDVDWHKCLRGLLVETAEDGVLYTHVGEHDVVPRGAVIVLTQGRTQGLPNAVVYRRGLLSANRGQMYASDYYEGVIPELRAHRNDMLWALEAIHRDDLTDPEVVRVRNARLQRIHERLDGSRSPRKARAAQHADRAQRREDKRGRANPMAAAFVTWGGTVQLDKELRVALKADMRVSRSRVAIVRMLGETWRVFHDVDAEMRSMERWWAAGRRRPLTRAQAIRLSERVTYLWRIAGTVTVAPYVHMPLVVALRDELFQFAVALADGARYRHAGVFVPSVRRLAGLLVVHKLVSQMLVVVGRLRRSGRPVAHEEQVGYLRAARQVRDALEALPPRTDTGIAFDFPVLDLAARLAAVERGGGDTPLDEEDAYAALDAALALYLPSGFSH